MTLSWSPSTDDRNPVAYRVYRNGVLIPMATPLKNTTFTDSNLKNNQSYTYTVQAYDLSPAQNTSAQSAPLTVKTGTNLISNVTAL